MSEIIERLKSIPTYDVDASESHGHAYLNVDKCELGDYIKVEDLNLALKDIEQIIDDDRLEHIASMCR